MIHIHIFKVHVYFIKKLKKFNVAYKKMKMNSNHICIIIVYIVMLVINYNFTHIIQSTSR